MAGLARRQLAPERRLHSTAHTCRSRAHGVLDNAPCFQVLS